MTFGQFWQHIAHGFVHLPLGLCNLYAFMYASNLTFSQKVRNALVVTTKAVRKQKKSSYSEYSVDVKYLLKY